MDIAICAGLGIIEAFALSLTGIGYPYGLTFTQTVGICLFLQYVALTFYRVFLYHKYFSPFRHLPGPTVRSPFSVIGPPSAMKESCLM